MGAQEDVTLRNALFKEVDKRRKMREIRDNVFMGDAAPPRAASPMADDKQRVSFGALIVESNGNRDSEVEHAKELKEACRSTIGAWLKRAGGPLDEFSSASALGEEPSSGSLSQGLKRMLAPLRRGSDKSMPQRASKRGSASAADDGANGDNPLAA